MKLFLDDIRSPPDGWVCVKTVEEVITFLKSGIVTELSLDNDLGPGQQEGHRVVYWMISNDCWPTNKPQVHSKNPIRAKQMQEDIDKYFPQRGQS